MTEERRFGNGFKGWMLRVEGKTKRVEDALQKFRKFSATFKLEVSICREDIEHKSDGDEGELKTIYTLLAIVARH